MADTASGFSYVITARAPVAGAFGGDVGPTLLLKVAATAAAPSPGDSIKRDDWVREVSARAGRTRDVTGVERGDVLAFVHGYDTTPAVSLQRHRVLAADLQHHGYGGAIVSFDWPAGQQPLAYLDDREKAKLTAFRLVSDCIELFARLQGRDDCTINVHLLAHSTGAYVVREAFDDADDRRAIAAVNWTASQVALIAADVSAASMAEGNAESDSIYRHCVRLTNYANPFDGALQLSNVKRAGLAPRAGRVRLPADVPSKAVDVDCGEYYQAMIETRPPGTIIGIPSHSWYIGDPVFTADLASTLNGDLDRRAISTRQALPNGQYKLVDPQPLVAAAGAVPVPVRPVGQDGPAS